MILDKLPTLITEPVVPQRLSNGDFGQHLPPAHNVSGYFQNTLLHCAILLGVRHDWRFRPPCD
jgi:hypothetical protein